MPDKDIVLAKVAKIQKCLDRIRDVTGLDPESLEDIDKQDIFVLNLQRAIQACIDLAAHAISCENLGLPERVRDNFIILKEKGIIDVELASGQRYLFSSVQARRFPSKKATSSMPMKKRFAVGSGIAKTANCAPLPKKRKTRYFSSMQPMNLARPT